MTVREICIKFGFEIDKGSEKKVRDTVESMKKMSSGLLKGFQVMFRASGAEDVVKEIQDSIDSLKQAEKAADDMEESFRGMGDSASNAGKEISGAFKNIPESLPEVSELPVKRSSGQTEYIPEQTKHPVPETGSEHTPEQSRMPVESVHVDISRGIENIAAVSGKTMKQVLDDLERIAGGYEQLGMDAETSMKKAYNDIQNEQRKISLDAVAEETGKTSEEVQAELGRAAKAYEQLGMDAESAMKRAYGDIIKDSERASSEIEKMTVDLSSGFGNIAEESGKSIREVVADLKTAAAGYEKLGDDAETAMRKAYTDIQKNQKMLSLQKIAEENKKTVDEIQRDLQEAAAAYEKLGMDAESAMKRAYDDIIRDSERCSSQVKQNVSSNADAVGKSTDGIAGTLKKVARIAVVAFSAVKVKEFGSECSQAAASANALSSQFEQTFGDLEGAAAKGLKKISEDTGVAVNRMKGSYAQIAAFAKTTRMSTDDSLALTKRSMVAVADSAAYYDRSLEDVTDSLQSFLKGNYENDAALGLSCTETTRNAAANALYGKSFKELSESEKQMTLLQMVEDANKLSGALGQAARESDTLENQTGNLKQSFQDLKAAIGQHLLQPVITGIKYLAKGVQYVTDKVPDMADAFKKAADKITGGEENVQRKMEQIHALVKRLQPAAERMLVSLRDGVAKAVSELKMIVERFGGMENLLKLLAIAAGAFLLVMNWGNIMDGARSFVAMLKSIGKMFSFANLKILGVVALVVLLALIVEDFINFLMGNDSLIGEIFDGAGIGADNARKAIFDAWDKISGFLLGVWDFIKTAAGMWIDNVTGFFHRHTESIQKNFKRAWRIVGDFLLGVWTFLSQLASALFGDTEESIDGSTKSTKDKLLAVWQSILDAISSIWDMLYECGSAVFNAIATVIETVFKWIKAFWNSWGSEILSWFKVLWDSIGGTLNGFLDIIKGVANFISSVFTGDWQGAWEAIKSIFQGVWYVIVNFITAVWETIKLLFSMALSAISAIWNAVWGAISSFFQGIWNGIVSFLSGIWSTITGIVSGAINGIYNVVSSVLSAISSFFSNIFSSIGSFVSNTFSNMLSGITMFVGRIKDAIVNGFTTAIDWIKGLPSQALQWGSDIIDGIANGIKGAIGKVRDAVKGVADNIKSFLHFSVPDEGPLTEYETWMPDFMQGLAKGIEDNKDVVLDTVRTLADGMSVLMQAAAAHPETVAASTINNTNQSSVNQYNTFNSTYTGSDRETVRNVSKGMKKSATDATTELARALEFSRG